MEMITRHRNRKSREPMDRFIEKVKKTDKCWFWVGAKCNTFGHGRFDIGRNRREPRGMSAHRASWILHHGEIRGNLFVLHKCRTHCCVNPKHLYLGTQRDNVHDSIRDGTHRRGESHPNHKVTDKMVKKIREMYKTGSYSFIKLSKKFRIGGPTIWKIVTKKAWKHVV